MYTNTLIYKYIDTYDFRWYDYVVIYGRKVINMTRKRPFGLDVLFSPHLIYAEHLEKLTPEVHQQLRDILNETLCLVDQPRAEAIQILKSVLNTLDNPVVHATNKTPIKSADSEFRVY